MISYCKEQQSLINNNNDNVDDFANFNTKNISCTPDDYNNKFKDFYTYNTSMQDSNKNSTNVSAISYSYKEKGNLHYITNINIYIGKNDVSSLANLKSEDLRSLSKQLIFMGEEGVEQLGEE